MADNHAPSAEKDTAYAQADGQCKQPREHTSATACPCGSTVMVGVCGCCIMHCTCVVPPAGAKADYLLDGSPEAVAIVREARGLPPLDTSVFPPVETEAPR